MTISCITIWQPWASLIAYRAKRFEFRSWPAPAGLQGQRIGIHAGKRQVSKEEIWTLLDHLRSSRAPATGIDLAVGIPLLLGWALDPSVLPRSSLLCTAVLGTHVRNEELAERLGVDRVNDSDRDSHSNWGWPLSDVHVVEPFLPLKGKRGFFSYEGEL